MATALMETAMWRGLRHPLALASGRQREFREALFGGPAFQGGAAKEVLFNVGSYDGPAEEAATKLLAASSLSLRQIKNAVKHIAITLLFNRSDDEEFAAAFVFVGLVRHISPEAYEAIRNGRGPRRGDPAVA